MFVVIQLGSELLKTARGPFSTSLHQTQLRVSLQTWSNIPVSACRWHSVVVSYISYFVKGFRWACKRTYLVISRERSVNLLNKIGQVVLLRLRKLNVHCEWRGKFPTVTSRSSLRLRFHSNFSVCRDRRKTRRKHSLVMCRAAVVHQLKW